MMSSKNWHK